MRGQTNASNIGGTIGDDTHPVKIVNGVATAVPRVLVASPSNGSQSTNGRFYNSSGRFIGSVRDISRSDLTLDAYNPTTGYITRLTITQTDAGVCRLLLEKWDAAIDNNGNPYATVYRGGTEIGSFQ